MQASWIPHLFSHIEKVRGWGKFNALIDIAYLLYYRLRNQSARDILATKYAGKCGTVLILCKGNVCRSAFLAEYLRKIVYPTNHLKFLSAGLRTRDGSMPPEFTISCAAEYGLDLSAHRGNYLRPKQIKDADLVVGMEPLHHLEFCLRFLKWRKKFLLLRTLENKPQSLTVPDPLFKERSDFKECFELLAKDGNLLIEAMTNHYRGAS